MIDAGANVRGVLHSNSVEPLPGIINFTPVCVQSEVSPASEVGSLRYLLKGSCSLLFDKLREHTFSFH
jgi:hypothetical protein